jgi:hypothetical protein
VRGDPRDRDRGTDIPPAALFRRVGHSLADEPSRIHAHGLASQVQSSDAATDFDGDKKGAAPVHDNPPALLMAGLRRKELSTDRFTVNDSLT